MTEAGYEYTINGKILQLTNVGLAFDDKVILRNIDAQINNYSRVGVQQGQIVGLLGPSGIGKTQLFKMMAGLEVPGATTAGQILLGDGEGVPVRRGLVGVVAQQYPLFRHRTVQGNLLVAAQQAARPGVVATDAAASMLELFGLGDQRDHYPDQLSGGQRQRVAIAQQLLCSEHVVLMDEPFSGLDPNMVDVVTDLLVRVSLQHEHNTIVVVTHDISAALAIADTLWVLGRDRAPDGTIIPGARIQHNIDLVQEGLAWHPGVRELPRFRELHNDIRRAFKTL